MVGISLRELRFNLFSDFIPAIQSFHYSSLILFLMLYLKKLRKNRYDSSPFHLLYPKLPAKMSTSTLLSVLRCSLHYLWTGETTLNPFSRCASFKQHWFVIGYMIKFCPSDVISAHAFLQRKSFTFETCPMLQTAQKQKQGPVS